MPLIKPSTICWAKSSRFWKSWALCSTCRVSIVSDKIEQKRLGVCQTFSNIPNFEFVFYQRAASMASVYTFLGETPTWRLTTSPFLNTKTVAMLRTPYLAANCWLASTSTLPTTALPSYSLLTSSLIGPTILQGPHQAAQKSTNTGLSLFRTNSSNVASVISSAILLVFVIVDAKLVK